MIYIASDHAGFQLKKVLITFIEKTLKLPLVDMGPTTYVENDDYPDFAHSTAKKVAENAQNIGILICGSGHGMCITANKTKGIRAILGTGIVSAEFARKDDDANILCLSAKTLSPEHARAVVQTFLTTAFSKEERHLRRLAKIAALE